MLVEKFRLCASTACSLALHRFEGADYFYLTAFCCCFDLVWVVFGGGRRGEDEISVTSMVL